MPRQFYAQPVSFWAERNAGLDEAQARIKIAGRNINNRRWADDPTLMVENEELKSLLMKVKEESEKVGLKLNIQNQRSWHPVPSLHGEYMGKNGKVTDYFLGLQNQCRCDGSHDITRCLLHLLMEKL